MTKVKIKQFRNKAKEPISGLIPEHTIYDKNEVILDAKLGNVNLQDNIFKIKKEKNLFRFFSLFL